MKIMITAKGPQMTDAIDPRFGRARTFMLVDTATGERTAHDNHQNLNAAQGAGIQAAQNVSALGAEIVISGNVGPKAFHTLTAAGIKVFLCHAGTVADAVRAFQAGELSEASSANVASHW